MDTGAARAHVDVVGGCDVIAILDVDWLELVPALHERRVDHLNVHVGSRWNDNAVLLVT